MTKKIYELNIGDWSFDGHNHVESFYVLVPEDFTYEQMRAGYDKTVAEFGIDPATDLFNEYEDSTFPAEYVNIFKAVGVSDDGTDDGDLINDWDRAIENGEEMLYMGEYVLAMILMMFIQHSTPDFSWEFIKVEGILIGGYEPSRLAGEVPDPSLAHIRSSAGYGLYCD